MKKKIGAHLIEDGACEFRVWAPNAKNITVDIVSPSKRSIPLGKDEFGYWEGRLEDINLGSNYFYNIDNEKKRPDPASQFQPEGVHGPSQLVHHNYLWEDQDWKGIPLKEMIIYELHTGTFTTEGTFEAIIPKLDYLLELGVNAIEIMPISQFPGGRNWGYDGVFPFAPQNSYGGVDGLKRLVNACHKKGVAVVLDVVYNHMGPEGNYLNDYGPYFTSKYSTPWGKSLNFDDEYSDAVRNFFIQNALMWFGEYHIDALRLDAVHAIKDLSAKHFLQELAENVKQLSREVNRELVLIAECDLNDPKFINPIEQYGFGLDGQWVDEFHHSLRSLVTGEKDGYYSDFGSLDHLRRAFQYSFVYTGNYSEHRKKTFGAEPTTNPYSQFVVFSQNHDQIGNRMLGDRISTTVSFEAQKLMAATYLISPYVPMLFMGEEYGEENPFQYFISHTDKDLVEAVRNGRKKEFEYFNWQGEVPDPQSEETFNKCKLNWDFADDIKKSTLLNFYKKLIQLRKTNPAFKIDSRGTMSVKADEEKGLLIIERFDKVDEATRKPLLLAFLNYNKRDTSYSVGSSRANWKKYLDSADTEWMGYGNPSPDLLTEREILPIRQHSVIIYENR
jgi:maltooligosyltrehalose trehalohydrolase